MIINLKISDNVINGASWSRDYEDRRSLNANFYNFKNEGIIWRGFAPRILNTEFSSYYFLN